MEGTKVHFVTNLNSRHRFQKGQCITVLGVEFEK